jgi:hypothetical protein
MAATIVQNPRAAPDTRVNLVNAIIATMPVTLRLEPCRLIDVPQTPRQLIISNVKKAAQS